MVYLAQLNYKQLKHSAMFTNFFGSLILKRITGIEVRSNNFFHAESFPLAHILPANSQCFPSSAFLQFAALVPMKLCGKTKANSGARGKYFSTPFTIVRDRVGV